MTVIERLPEIVYPLTQVNKVNEIVDVLNVSTNSSYTELNPSLTPVDGNAVWTVNHNLGTETVNCSVYNGDNFVIAKVSIISENTVTVTLNSSVPIPASTYKVVVMAQGSIGSSGGGGGGYTLPVASTSTLGGVKIDGTSITIDGNGIISSSVDSALSEVSENPVQNKAVKSAIDTCEPKDKVFKTLNSQGTVNLEVNSVNKITLNGAVVFSLPSISDNSKLYQILVQMYTAGYYSINLGTTLYFNATAPDFSGAGYFTIIWEYDSLRNAWVVGASRKAGV